jgi:hypothetical protein
MAVGGASVLAQAPQAPKTPWGHPDLQGLWTAQTLTPLERPRELAGKEFFTAEEIAQFEKERVESRNQDRRDGSPEADVRRAYNEFWWDQGTKVVPTRRTSLIVDPKDGRIPFTTEGAKLNEAHASRYGVGPFDSYAAMDTGERCLTDGVPILPGAYNNNFLIVQNPTHVVIVGEMYGDRRVIPVDGRPTPNVPKWLGNARGRWEGNTLVVESTNFLDKTNYWWAQAWRAARPTLKLTERFTRVDANTIDYQFTIEDPTMFTRPWTAAVPLSNNPGERGVTSGRQYEYACHEGNQSIVNVLSGAREAEKAAGAPASGSR